MAIMLTSPIVRCTNCGHVGKATVGSGCVLWIVNLFVYVVTIVLYWPLVLLAILFTLGMILRKADLTCGKCGAPYPVRLDDSDLAKLDPRNDTEQF